MHCFFYLIPLFATIFSEHQSETIGSHISNPEAAKSTHGYALITKEQALEAVKTIQAPSGVTLTGTVESIHFPAQKVEQYTKGDGEKHEQLLGGYGNGLGAWGGLGSWGGCGPWRFGYSCGGFGGWAYPLGYWNAFGSGLYGGGCGLGFASGGLFYC